jgi:hypothetical protein
MTAKGKHLKVEIDHRREFEKVLFERKYHSPQTTLLDHRGFALFTQLLLNQPLHVRSLEDLQAVLSCLEIEELSVSKALHDNLIVVSDLTHRSSLSQVEMEWYAQTLILSYLRHTTDFHAVHDLMQKPDLTEDEKLSRMKLNLYVSDTDRLYFSRVAGFVLSTPGAHIHQHYLVDFVS